MADSNTSLPVRTETHGDVVVRVGDGTTPAQQLNVDTQGRASAKLLGDYDAATNTTPSSAGLVAHDRGATIDETSQNKRVTAIGGTDDTVCLDVALRDEAGAPFTEANPLHVVLSETSGTEVHDYATASAVAAGASSDHEYTAAAEFDLKQILASASGKLKVELQVETAAASGVFNTKAVAFNSTAIPNICITLAFPVVVPVGAKVRIIRKNQNELQAQDLYSTIIGIE